ncbi:MAG: hypothetical protein HOE62_15605 [Alphaproteobacteria bacterium]|jgi:hypothetical protein|nr:hypothetical protein [Alphaproteobacteria bacterium]MBT4019377.1 hypothetical protein [Alphaproteobacteria bacterium]MBT5160666.1 hypothetical protein [Alphaproteobacteria bacterium]MBT7744559.1 hypothetical protein [Alphaproteobacteria bacterium]
MDAEAIVEGANLAVGVLSAAMVLVIGLVTVPAEIERITKPTDKPDAAIVEQQNQTRRKQEEYVEQHR